jgi:hypothetical protein
VLVAGASSPTPPLLLLAPPLPPLLLLLALLLLTATCSRSRCSACKCVLVTPVVATHTFV